MEKLKRSKIRMFTYVVIIVAVAFCGNWLYKNRRVHFEDDMMRQVICLELGKDKDSKDITYRELEQIEELRIGPVGTFETIEDVAKCKNLKQLLVNVEITDRDAYYELYQKTEDGKMYYPPIDEKKIKKVQDELEEILKRDKKIEVFRFTNVNESCNIKSFEFFKYAKNLREIGISFANAKDYSVLGNCSNLKKVDLWYSDIEIADNLLKLKNVEKFWLTGTPLAQNKEEISRLEKAFPDAWIITE